MGREIEGIYAGADRYAVRTGVPHHTDQIVALVTKHPVTRQQLACGLPVPWPRCVKTAADNLNKGCYFGGWA